MTTDVALGTRIASQLIALGDSIGLQYIVFAGNRFDVGARHRFAAYEGTHKHRDHLHVELATAGAMAQLPWFSNTGAIASAGNTETGGAPLGDAGDGSPIGAWGAAIGVAAVIGGTIYRIFA